MAAFVEATDFDGYPYSLPNLDKSPNTFASFRTAMEKKALIDLLGYSFYDAFVTGLDDLPILQMWTDLRDGAEYTHEGKTYKYEGLKDLLIPYIYSEWIRADFEKYSGVGTVKPKAKNATVVSPSKQISRGWNDYVRKLGFSENVSLLYGVYYNRYSYCSDMNKNSLYGLLESNDAYPDYEFNYPGTINVFDL